MGINISEHTKKLCITSQTNQYACQYIYTSFIKSRSYRKVSTLENESPAHRQGNALCPLSGPWKQREIHYASKVAETVIIHSVRKDTAKHSPVWTKFYNHESICTKTSQRFKMYIITIQNKPYKFLQSLLASVSEFLRKDF